MATSMLVDNTGEDYELRGRSDGGLVRVHEAHMQGARLDSDGAAIFTQTWAPRRRQPAAGAARRIDDLKRVRSGNHASRWPAGPRARRPEGQ